MNIPGPLLPAVVAPLADGVAVVPADLPEPRLSPALAWRIGRVLESGDRELEGVTKQDRAEAKASLPALEALCAWPGAELVEAWLNLVALSVTNTPPAGIYQMRVALVVETSGDLPMACFTRATRAAFARTDDGKWFPGDAEVDRFLRPIGRRLQWKLHAARKIAAAVIRKPPAEPAPREMTREERTELVEAFTARREAFEAERAERLRKAVHSLPDRSRAACLTGERLWEGRNRARRELGMPPLPRPASFDGYGVER